MDRILTRLVVVFMQFVSWCILVLQPFFHNGLGWADTGNQFFILLEWNWRWWSRHGGYNAFFWKYLEMWISREIEDGHGKVTGFVLWVKANIYQQLWVWLCHPLWWRITVTGTVCVKRVPFAVFQCQKFAWKKSLVGIFFHVGNSSPVVLAGVLSTLPSYVPIPT